MNLHNFEPPYCSSTERVDAEIDQRFDQKREEIIYISHYQFFILVSFDLLLYETAESECCSVDITVIEVHTC